jgi:hypothetical protein
VSAAGGLLSLSSSVGGTGVSSSTVSMSIVRAIYQDTTFERSQIELRLEKEEMTGTYRVKITILVFKMAFKLADSQPFSSYKRSKQAKRTKTSLGKGFHKG